MIALIINQKQQHMKKLIFLMVALVSFGMMAQDSKAYLALNVGASFPGGDVGDELELGTGVNLNLNFGYRFNESLGATLTYGGIGDIFKEMEGPDAGASAVFINQYFGLGPTYTIALGDNLAWDIKPQYLLTLSAAENYEEDDMDVEDIEGSGWLLGQSLVFGLDSGLKFCINLDYINGKYDDIPNESVLVELEGSKYSSFVLGVGARYNF